MEEITTKKEWLKPELKAIMNAKMDTESDSTNGYGGDASGYAS